MRAAELVKSGRAAGRSADRAAILRVRIPARARKGPGTGRGPEGRRGGPTGQAPSLGRVAKSVSKSGGFCLEMERGGAFEVFPDAHDGAEQWRLLQRAGPHFAFGNAGLSEQ